MRQKTTFLTFFLLLAFLCQNLWAAAIPISSPNQNANQSQQVEAATYQAMVVLNEDTVDATGPSVSVKQHRIVKLLSPEAVQRYARALEFEYVEPAQSWSIDNVQITSVDGKVESVPVADAKVISPLEKFPPYDKLKIAFLPLKDLQPGDTLDYTATFTEQLWIPGEYWDGFYLQDQDPITKETVTLIEKGEKEAQVAELHGTLPAAMSSEKNGVTTRVWEWDNVAPFPDLGGQLSPPPVADLAPKLVITTLKSWEDVARGVEGAYLTPAAPSDLTEVTSKYLSGVTGNENILRATYGFVDQGIRSLPLRMGGDFGVIMHPLDFGTVVKQGLGDSRDKAALLASLLKKEGFDAELALISTASNGNVQEDFPDPGAFNRLLVRLVHNGKVFWFDPFVENCPFGYLPPEDQGRKALLLETGEFADTPVLSPSDNSREVVAKAVIESDGSLVETMDITANGSDSIAMRTLLRNVAPDQRQQVIGALASQIAQQPKIDQVSLSSVDDLNSPLDIGLKFEAKNYAVSAGDLYFFLMPFNSSTDLDAIANQTGQREYPFLLGTTTQDLRKMEISIPAGYKLRYLPKGTKLSNLVGSYTASFKTEKGKLIFRSDFVLNEATVPADQFALLKGLVDEKLKVEGVRVVFEKVKGKKVGVRYAR